MTNQTQNKRDSFIFYRSFFEASKCLKTDEKAQLFDAICSYALDEEISDLDGTAQGMFKLVKPQLDANRKRFKNGCVKKQNRSKTEAKRKQKGSKKEANVNVNVNVNPNVNVESKLIISPIYKELSDGLLFVLESKLQRKLSSRNWENEIKKLIEKDLSVRQNPLEDVKRAIQTIADNYGKNYFPIIQSAESLRQKFTKIEDYVKRNNSLQNQKLTKDQQQDLINKQLEEAYANNQDF